MSNSPLRDAPSVAIIVPALQEAERIAASMRRLREDFPGCELVVVDGGSTDSTVAAASPYARVLSSAAGRATQMNVGARATTADVLWFIHADVRVDPAALQQLRSALADARVVGGGLSLQFDRRSRSLDLLARSSNARARRLHQIFGDQSMFVRRSVFDSVGGFPELPLMEDFELTRRLQRIGRLALLPATSTASARRFDTYGTVPMIAFMQCLKIAYLAGMSPQRIHDLYRAGPPIRRRARTSDGVRHAPAAH